MAEGVWQEQGNGECKQCGGMASASVGDHPQTLSAAGVVGWRAAVGSTFF